jgi:hypothetical protein
MQIARNTVLAIAMLVSPALAFPAFAQTGIVKGRVLKKIDGTGILNTIVRIKDSDKSTRTDEKGNYTFDSLNASNYTLEISKNPLYDPGNTTVTVSANVTVEAENVALARREPDVKAIRELLELLKKGDLAQFETELERREQECRGETDDYCKKITAVGRLIDKNRDRPNL